MIKTKKYYQIDFNPDHEQPLGKIFSFHNMAVVAQSVFQGENIYFAEVCFKWMFVWF